MGAFFESFAGYVIEMMCLIAVGALGGYAGYRLRMRKNKENGAGEEE